jgi:hypothetical protein
LAIPEEKHHSWNINCLSNQEERKHSFVNVSDKGLENINRLNLGYDEAPFSYVTKIRSGSGPSTSNPFLVRFMHSVVNDNLSNWLGYDSLVSDNSSNPPLGGFNQ